VPRSSGNLVVPKLDTSFKLIRDPIHGNIQLTPVEFDILQLPALLRLHDIHQTGVAHLVYPGAVGTRFTHSIGTMHVASLIAYQLLESIGRDAATDLFPGYDPSDLSGIVQLVRIAALLHDVGHGPFSHTTEEVMRWVMRETHRAEWDATLSDWGWKAEPDRFPIHEYFSTRLILDGKIKGALAGSAAKRRGRSGAEVRVTEVAALLSKKKRATGAISPQGLGVLRAIVSSEVDADRMDYLVRDSYLSGLPYGQVDPYRLISQMSIGKSKGKHYHVCFRGRAVGSLEDFQDARYKMYKWFAGHHMVVAADSVLRGACFDALDDGVLTPDDFWWENFDAGGASDSLILSAITKSISQDSPFRGLMDRRYLPVSLLKIREHWDKLEREVQQHLKLRVHPRMLETLIEQFIRGCIRHPQDQVDGDKVYRFAVTNPRTPYRPIEGQSAIWVATEDGALADLSTVSPYYEAITREWSVFPSYYISYCVPGKMKAEAKKIKEKVWSAVIEGIAES
jgi:HD superfamily phosphohydrolase